MTEKIMRRQKERRSTNRKVMTDRQIGSKMMKRERGEKKGKP